MKITSIKSVGRKPVYDLSINSDKYDEQQYVLANGVITHNTGLYYSADDIWILGRRQNKEGTSIVGYDFVINVDKSRYVREKSIIPISVTWEGGVDAYSGLLDVALAGQFVVKPSNGWYSKVDQETGEVEDKKYRAKELTADFWSDILASNDFKDFVEENFKINGKINVEVVDVDELEV